MRLVQVCNVGRILGGTAACAWTVTRALPDVEHTVVFLSKVSPETSAVFGGCRIEEWSSVTDERLSRLLPDLVVLHNVHADRCEPIRSSRLMQYVHSRGRRADADVTMYCSRWLARACGADEPTRVLYQAVPRPDRNSSAPCRSLRARLVVGRICTPSALKWPESTVEFYGRLADRFPSIRWEFVGCPDSLEACLNEACRGRARFHPAAWSARRRLWEWDVMLYHHPGVTESFGRTAAESLRAGCIPVVDARGGFVEQIPRDCGFLCQSAAGFSEALQELLDPGVRFRMSRAAMAHADQAFSLQRFRSDFLSVVRATLQTRP